MPVSNTKSFVTMHVVKRAVLLAMSLFGSAAISLAQQTGGYGVPGLPGTGTNGTIAFNGAPTGNCSSTQTAVDTTTGNYYSCNNSAWQKVGPGSGGSPSGTAGGSLAGTYPNPSLATQAANTLFGNNTGSSAAPAALTVSQVAALLGLGTAANQPASAFDASGAASAAQAASLQKATNLSDLASASTARTNLGLGTAATQASGAFDASGAAATAQANAIAASAPVACANGSYACSASPAFTGTPTAPTQAISTNNTDIATTAAVTAALAGVGGGNVSGQAAGVIPLGTGATALAAQSHLDDGNTVAGQITSVEPFNVTNTGAFSPTASHSYSNTAIGGCQPLATNYIANNASYYNVQYSNNATIGMLGCVLDTLGNVGAASLGVVGLAASNDATADSVGVYSTGFALANGAGAYGANPIAQDVSGLTSSVSLISAEMDVQPENGPSAYTGVTGIHVRLFNPTNIGGTYPGSAIVIQGGTQNSTGAYFQNGLTFAPGALGGASTGISFSPLATATSSFNFGCPQLLAANESYWNGSAAVPEAWTLGCNLGQNGTNPANDYLQIGHGSGTAPVGQTHALELLSGVNLQVDSSTYSANYSYAQNPKGVILGDSIWAGYGTTAAATYGAAYQILAGLGVASGSITTYALNGSGIEYAANQQLNSASASVATNTITTIDGFQNDGSQITASESGWQTAKQAALAAELDAATIGPAADTTGFPSKQYATSATVTGTSSSAANYTNGKTCSGGACTFTWTNVPGQDVFILVEVDTTGAGAGYNPTVVVDGTTFTGSWSSGTWLTAFTESYTSTTFSPWPIHVSLPSVGNGGSGRHTVAITLPSGATAIEVIGSGGDRTKAGPMVVASGQFVWYPPTINYVETSNQVWQSSTLEAASTGFNVVFSNPEPYINGAISPTITWGTGCTVNPDVAITLSGGAVIAIANNTGGGGTCTSAPSISILGSGTGATAAATYSGGTITGYTVTAGGTGYMGQQQYNTSLGHPNNVGATAIATATLAKVQALTLPRNMDTGSGLTSPWSEHNASTGSTSVLLMPYAKLNTLVMNTGGATGVIDPGKPGQTTRVQVCAAGSYTFTFPANVYFAGTLGFTDTPAPASCDLWTLTMTSQAYSGSSSTVNTWYAAPAGATNATLANGYATLPANNTFSGTNTHTGEEKFSNSATGTNPGTLFSGSPTTTSTYQPLVAIDTAGATAPVRGSAGTMLEVNAPSGFSTSGSLLTLNVNGVQEFSVNGAGGFAFAGGGSFGNTVTAGTMQTLTTNARSTGYLGWASTGSASGTIDTVLCRGSVGGVVIAESAATCTNNIGGGNGTMVAGTVYDTGMTVAGIVTNTSAGILGTSTSLPAGVTNGISAAITTATGGSGTSAVTCTTATCTNLRGTYTLSGGTFTTGSMLTLVWPTTPTAYVCISSVINSSTGASIGTNNAATATGIAFTALTSAAGLTVQIEYQCQP